MHVALVICTRLKLDTSSRKLDYGFDDRAICFHMVTTHKVIQEPTTIIQYDISVNEFHQRNFPVVKTPSLSGLNECDNELVIRQHGCHYDYNNVT